MDLTHLIDGLIKYLCLIVLLTFHEFGHAWTAWRCGDDTARLHGRVSLNPLAHIDPIGTVLLPLIMILLPGAGRFLLGWAKPVPVNPYNLRHPRVDDILVTLAGPGMNLVLAVLIMGFARVGVALHANNMIEVCVQMASTSLLLCFFNLIPIPPLDGSQVARSLFNLSYEAYAQFARFGMLILIVVLQIPLVREVLATVTFVSLALIAKGFGM
jgi:Zn-dependent protease